MTLAARKFFDTRLEQLTPQMEQEFFSSIMGRNKTYKTTFHNRFTEINQFLVEQIKNGKIHASHVLDIGMSSGISTLELFDALSTAGRETGLIGTDILIDAYVVSVGPGCDVLLDKSGFPLRFDLFGQGMKPWVTSADYKNGMFLPRKVANLLLTRMARRILERPGDSRIRRVRLITPRLLAKQHITVCDDDVAQYNPRFASKFDFIRAANVLNKAYFQDCVLAGMIRNLRRYLAGTDAALLVVRTHQDMSNHGTLFRLADDNRFEVVSRFGAGSEIEKMVLCDHS